MKELDNNDEYGKKSIINTEARAKENNPGQEFEASWSTAVVRGDMFYNEEETEVLEAFLMNGGTWVSFHGSAGGFAEKPRKGEGHQSFKQTERQERNMEQLRISQRCRTREDAHQ